MPIISLQKIASEMHLAVWEITETHDELLAMLPSEILTDNELVTISHPLKQVEFFASRLCIQYLANELNINYLGIKKDEHGKPFLVGSGWQMSLTHTKKYIAVVMHPTKKVGIDMEKPTEKLRKIAHKFLSNDEVKEVNNDLEKLSIYWSAKEAMYKLYGKRKVIFDENLVVFPFEKDEKNINGKINMETYQVAIALSVSCWEEYILVIGIENFI